MTGLPPLSRPVIVHGLEEALMAVDAAEAAGRAALLVSPPGAAGHAGAGWFRALADRLTERRREVRFVAVLDCADCPGRVLEALRAGVRELRFAGDGPARPAVTAIAAAEGARLWRDLGPALDLRGSGKPHAAVRGWMAGEDLPGLAVAFAEPPAVADGIGEDVTP